MLSDLWGSNERAFWKVDSKGYIIIPPRRHHYHRHHQEEKQEKWGWRGGRGKEAELLSDCKTQSSLFELRCALCPDV